MIEPVIRRGSLFDYWEGEKEPPSFGPKIWFRPSDMAHFSRGKKGWSRYTPINLKVVLKEGESVKVKVP